MSAESSRRWLFVVTRNLCMNHFRNTSAHQEYSLDESWQEPTHTLNPADTLIRQERALLVKRSVAALLPVFREVIVLREYEHMSYAEIAHITCTSIGTVKSRIARARQELRAMLAPLLEVEE